MLLTLVALHKGTSFHPPTKLFFLCLAISDLCVGVITQPLFAIIHSSWVTSAISRKSIYRIDRRHKASVQAPVSVFFFFLSSMSLNIWPNGHGPQISSPVIWIEIQTCCITTTTSCSCRFNSVGHSDRYTF